MTKPVQAMMVVGSKACLTVCGAPREVLNEYMTLQSFNMVGNSKLLLIKIYPTFMNNRKEAPPSLNLFFSCL